MSGKEVETKTNADGSVMHRGVTGPMRDHAFMASERYTITPTDVDGTRINAVHYEDDGPNGTAGTDSVLKYASQAFDTYSKTFGDYPFAEFNVVENPTPTGVEFPGVIQIAERAWSSNSGYLETLVAHETGHQWFYSLVGNNQVEHPWLDESLTSYLEIVYIRAIYKDNTQTTDYINRFLAEYSGYIAFSPDLPLDLPVSSYSGVGYGAIVYAKGPLFFVALDRTVGLDTAYKALSTYFKRYEYKVVTSADVEKTFEEVSGKDLSDIFKKWVTGGGTNPTATPRPIVLEPFLKMLTTSI
jgi:predicted metalloprotease with PDZ domain